MLTIIIKLLLTIIGPFLISVPLTRLSSIATLLFVISITALLHYFDNRTLTIIAMISLIVASLFIPYLIAYLPLLCFVLLEFNLIKLTPLLAIPLLFNQPFYRIETLALVFIVIVFAGITRYVCNQLENLLAENKKIRDNSIELQLALQRKNKALSENYENNIHHVTLKERNRIARDIHDNVGHLLSRSILQIGAVQAIIQSKEFKDSINWTKEFSETREDYIEDSIDDLLGDSIEDSIKDSLDSLKETLDLAMTSVRQNVHNLRDDSIDLEEAISKMIEPMTCDVELNYDMSNEIENNVKFCFLGVLGEAITNISKHSNATTVTITLKEHPAFYQLLIQDNGSVQAEESSVGMGITNMEKRVEALDGHFNIHTKNGFKIFVSVPKVISH